MPKTPAPRRITRLSIAAAAVCATLTALTAPTATGATPEPSYQGHGWKANTDSGIYSLNPDPYEIVWADATARSKLKQYLLRPAAQADAVTGVTITVTDTIDLTPSSVCPPRHRIVVHWRYRPYQGLAGYSTALPCHQLTDGSAWGGHILMDSESYSVPGWFSSNATMNETYKKNGVVHELGHILGLDHANTDVDKDGAVEPYECVKNPTGWLPTMCSPSGGYRNATSSGQFVGELDVIGLKQLAANWYLRQG